MSQCRGTTKAGKRCQRGATEGSEYCAAHTDQAAAAAGATSASTSGRGADLILIGAVALALAALRRVIRLI
ncbi:MAG: hypothetical protein R3195_15855 [Gemmatimonadota bacterium]|nr:hypothetical protein [Gemmatimonadota bacterium]